MAHSGFLQRMLEIRFCRLDEIEKLQNFLHEKWKASHVLSRSKDLLLWQHHEDGMEFLNYVVAVLETTGEFVGILGFIPLWKFDPTLKHGRQIWLSLWKVDERPGLRPGIGLGLLSYLEEKLEPHSIGVLGINEQVIPLYNWLGYQTGEMNHFYISNPAIEAKIASNLRLPKITDSGTQNRLLPIDDPSGFDWQNPGYLPEKNIEFIINRYKKHPWYQYLFLRMTMNNGGVALIVYRKVKTDNSTCLRIVDIWGDIYDAVDCTNDWINILKKEGAEYVDCLNAGWESQVFEKMGFCLKSATETIPEYFEPFEPKNMKIRYAVLSATDKRYVFFKGDTDQDRPNKIN